MSSPAETRPSPRAKSFFSSEAGVIWTLWLTYGSFYFCRTNISAAVPGIEAELNLTKTQIGSILGALKISYGIGQFINGQLAEKINPRILLAIGMLMSAALNVVFGFGAGVFFLIFIWACNGYFQSLGWTPCMRVAANWFTTTHRGRAIGIIGTGYQLTAALTYLIAGGAVHWLGWRGALYVPAMLLAGSAIHMLIGLRERPESLSEEIAEASSERAGNHETALKKHTVFQNILFTLSNPGLWLLGVSLGLLNACRYGFLDWGITFLVETRGDSIGKAAVNYTLLPLGGIAGSLITGWMTDRFFGGRRGPVIFGMLLLLTILTLFYHQAVETSLVLSVVMLVFIGFTIFGPQVLLVGTAPIDLARHGTAAAAVGFVNFMGYVGAYSGDRFTGTIVDRYDWQAALWFWAACAIGSGLTAAFLWRKKT